MTRHGADFSGSGFTFDGVIANLDETLPHQPYHPSTVLLIDASKEMMAVIVPAAVLGDKLPLLSAGTRIQLRGKVEMHEGRRHYVATRLRLSPGE